MSVKTVFTSRGGEGDGLFQQLGGVPCGAFEWSEKFAYRQKPQVADSVADAMEILLCALGCCLEATSMLLQRSARFGSQRTNRLDPRKSLIRWRRERFHQRVQCFAAPIQVRCLLMSRAHPNGGFGKIVEQGIYIGDFHPQAGHHFVWLRGRRALVRTFRWCQDGLEMLAAGIDEGQKPAHLLTGQCSARVAAWSEDFFHFMSEFGDFALFHDSCRALECVRQPHEASKQFPGRVAFFERENTPSQPLKEFPGFDAKISVGVFRHITPPIGTARACRDCAQCWSSP